MGKQNIVMLTSFRDKENAGNRRREIRENCWIKSRVAGQDNSTNAAVLLNCSDSGAMISTSRPVARGQIIKLVGLNLYRAVKCEVRWTSGEFVGIEYIDDHA